MAAAGRDVGDAHGIEPVDDGAPTLVAGRVVTTLVDGEEVECGSGPVVAPIERAADEQVIGFGAERATRNRVGCIDGKGPWGSRPPGRGQRGL